MSDLQTIDAAERIAAALGGRPNGKGGFRCLCPAHDDRHHPNLDVDLGDGGKLLVNCTAGCAQAEVIEALRSRDLWPGSKPMTETEKQRAAEATSRRKKERRQEQEHAARQALDLYKAATGDPNNHPYTLTKGGLDLGPYVRRGAWPQREWKDGLIIPLYSAQGQITSLQAINTDGSKDFLKGGRKRGSFYPFGRFKDLTGQIWIAEGLATAAAVHAVSGAPCVMAVDAGNLSVVAETVQALAPEAEICIMADDDMREGKTDNPGIEAALRAARVVDGKVAVPNMGKRADAWDLWHEHGPDALRVALQAARPVDGAEAEPQTVQIPLIGKLAPIEIHDFLALEFPPRSNVLAPWLPCQGLCMVYAARGIGKTFFALSVAYAVASGGSFLKWSAPTPRGVLYIDGEMPAAVMQTRLSSIVAGSELEATAPFVLLNPEMQPEGMPWLDTTEGQEALEAVLTDDIKLVIVDNISTLTRSKENESDSWTPVQGWALRQRAAGRSVLFVHHAGKTGQQRGTSKREDVLDTVLALRRPLGYQASQGAVFEVHFEKYRGLHGKDVAPVEATLMVDAGGAAQWHTRTVEDSTLDKVVAMLCEGMSQRDIAEELGVNKSTVSRYASRAKAEGLVEAT